MSQQITNDFKCPSCGGNHWKITDHTNSKPIICRSCYWRGTREEGFVKETVDVKNIDDITLMKAVNISGTSEDTYKLACFLLECEDAKRLGFLKGGPEITEEGYVGLKSIRVRGEFEGFKPLQQDELEGFMNYYRAGGECERESA